MIPWTLLAACVLFAFACGLVVGIFVKTWVDDADAEEAARREARKAHVGFDWRAGDTELYRSYANRLTNDDPDELTAQERYGQ